MQFKSEEKNRLRQQMLRLRTGLAPETRAKANRTIQSLISKHWDPGWKTILIYVNKPDEVGTISLIKKLISNGRTVCVPAFDEKQDSYFPSRLKSFDEEMEPGHFRILEPKPSKRRAMFTKKMDVIFVPGLAFDRIGNRLGYGRGYFDQLCRAGRAVKIGLAYDFQLVNRLIPHSNDVSMDFIITESGVIECQKT